MRTAIDTNILSGLWSDGPVASRMARQLADAHARGAVVICGPVYAELLAHPSASQDFIDDFISETGVFIDWDLGEDIWRQAGKSFAAYARRRRSSQGGTSKRMLVDFVVASHALLRADRLMTLDTGWYEPDFPRLRIV
ncbi:MAG TPA: type II toxin-antitoxin system VapC family toxin [Terriglobales bacterium]|jgi:predicted nucleic acid-binding protein|nr:type II toxin-antitoxin system VapC family toxin [Terriglobales bacterium]